MALGLLTRISLGRLDNEMGYNDFCCLGVDSAIWKDIMQHTVVPDSRR